MKLRREIVWNRDGDGPGYLFDPRCGAVVGVNDTARTILEGLATGHDEDGLVRVLVQKHRVPELAARGDVRAFLDHLGENDLLENERGRS